MLKKIGSLFALSLFAAILALAPPAGAQTTLQIGGNIIGSCGTATAAGNGTAATVTLSNKCGVVTTESITAPTASEYTLTMTNTVMAAADVLLWSVANGTNTVVGAYASTGTPGAGSGVFKVRLNGLALDGTLTIRYLIVKP